MIRTTCIVVAALCCLLALATSAYAECAWVLWSREGATRPNGSPEWTISTAAETLDQCRAERVKAIASFRQIFKERSRATDTSVVFSGTDAQGKDWGRLIMFECLPDTVDPRGGPKR